MRRSRRRVIVPGCRGSILLEVIVATMLVGILVVPLATAFGNSVNEARSVRQRAEELAPGGPGSAGSEAWEWAPRVIAAWWRPGPVLHVRVSGVAGRLAAATQVALWVDGWLVAQEGITSAETGATAGTSDLQVGPELWTGLTQGELVIRARVANGSWGPPWRLAVPEAGGGTPAPSPASSPTPQAATVVVHRPGSGNSPLTASWSGSALTSPPFALLFCLTPALQGWSGGTLDGRSQWWWTEDGRSVDIYF